MRFWDGILARHRKVIILEESCFDAFLAVQVWVCAGATAGVSWLSGHCDSEERSSGSMSCFFTVFYGVYVSSLQRYLMELLYSADHVWPSQVPAKGFDAP